MKNYRAHIVRDGDYLSLLAVRNGFDAEEVWNDSKNDEIRELREDMDLLAPGDLVYIPSQKKTTELKVKPGQANTYAAHIPEISLRVQFTYEGEVLAAEDIECDDIVNPPPDPPQTDGDGYLVLTVPMGTKCVSVRFPDRNLEFRLRVASLDPVETINGKRQRLLNLGYFAPLPLLGHTLSKKEVAQLELSRALAAFQADNDLPVTGDADPDTESKLEELFGS
jgi:hypothetical protein